MFDVLSVLFLQFFVERFSRLWDRRWSFKETISHKENQMDLNDLFLGPKLQIETKYAAILTLIFVDMTYSAAMVRYACTYIILMN